MIIFNILFIFEEIEFNIIFIFKKMSINNVQEHYIQYTFN